MSFSATVDQDEDGVWIVEYPAISGCVSQGKTKGEALDNIKEAIAPCLEMRAGKGPLLTIETQQIEVEALLSTNNCLPRAIFSASPSARQEGSLLNSRLSACSTRSR